MANKEHLKTLNNGGVEVWREFVQGQEYMVRAQLGGADLSAMDLQWLDLQGGNLHGADLQGADLVGANLEGADFQRVNLQRANLVHANPSEDNCIFTTKKAWGEMIRSTRNISDFQAWQEPCCREQHWRALKKTCKRVCNRILHWGTKTPLLRLRGR